MANKQAQEKLCTERKEMPAEALHFAKAFENGLKSRKSHAYINKEPKVKEEPIFAVSNSNSRECWRCGAGNSAQSTGRNVQLLRAKGPFRAGVQQEEKRYLQ